MMEASGQQEQQQDDMLLQQRAPVVISTAAAAAGAGSIQFTADDEGDNADNNSSVDRNRPANEYGTTVRSKRHLEIVEEVCVCFYYIMIYMLIVFRVLRIHIMLFLGYMLLKTQFM